MRVVEKITRLADYMTLCANFSLYKLTSTALIRAEDSLGYRIPGFGGDRHSLSPGYTGDRLLSLLVGNTYIDVRRKPNGGGAKLPEARLTVN